MPHQLSIGGAQRSARSLFPPVRPAAVPRTPQMLRHRHRHRAYALAPRAAGHLRPHAPLPIVAHSPSQLAVAVPPPLLHPAGTTGRLLQDPVQPSSRRRSPRKAATRRGPACRRPDHRSVLRHAEPPAPRRPRDRPPADRVLYVPSSADCSAADRLMHGILLLAACRWCP